MQPVFWNSTIYYLMFMAFQLFDRLRVERPNFRDKVTGVIGDCALPGLGISSDDRHMLAERVHVVIHGAATVK